MDIHRLFVSGKTLGLTSLVAVALLGFSSGSARADDPASASGEGSIFTPPNQVNSIEPGPQGGFRRKGGGQGKHGFRRGGARRGNHVGWRQIQMLPSLTPAQRKEIKDIYQQAKAEIQPDVQQIRAMKEQGKGKGLDGLSAENKEKFSAIKSRLQAKRQNVWQQVKVKLTAQQLDELEKMRAGDLKPPRLRDSKDG